MNKFEYSDLYKFITSVGIALIALAVLVPWLFLREPFDLLQPTSDLTQLTPLAQEIIAVRQATVQSILTKIPVFSVISFGVGLLGLIAGGIMWYRKTQMPLERITGLNIKFLEKQLTPFSHEEIKVQKEEEIKAQLEVEIQESHEQEYTPELEEVLKPDNVNRLVESAILIEKRLTGLLTSCFSNSHTILPHRRLGPIALDIVMASKTTASDYIFEVKYIRKGFKYFWLRDNILKFIYANNSYQKETNRKAIPVLFIVGNEKMTPSLVDVKKYIYRLQSELDNLESQASVVFVPEAEFYSMDCSKLKSKLDF
jgi:hypothetical protein